MKNHRVSKSNELVAASYELTKGELYLLLACISQIDSRVEASLINDQDEFVLKAEDMKDTFYEGDTNNNIYTNLRSASNKIFEREVTISLPNNEQLRTRFVSSILFQQEKSQVTITFAQKILPYLTQLKNNFTTYKLAEVVNLTSVHAIRLYELIVCWEGQNRSSHTLDLEDFKFILGISGKYKQFSQLRNSVINKAINQINEHTDYHVSATYRKFNGINQTVTFSYYKQEAVLLTVAKNLLSSDKIKAIVRTKQFMADYNDHKMLSFESRQTNVEFWNKAEQLLESHPEEFNKRPFDDYFKKVK